MAKKSGFYVKSGDKELLAAFRALDEAARGANLMIAAKAGILPIQNAAIENAPYLSGTLSRSIHTEEVEQTKHSAKVTTGTDLNYAARQEFGFNDTDALGRTYHQPARPYMRPAYDRHRADAIAEVSDALRSLILAAV
jgi:HK97 gp10 family phage protein